MKSRWIVNLILALGVAVAGLIVYFEPWKSPQSAAAEHRISSADPAGISSIRIEFTGKVPVVLEKREGYWFIRQPLVARADSGIVGHILSLLAETTRDKLPAQDLAQYDLHQPVLKLHLDQHEFIFGTHNPLDERQYVAHGGAIYLIPGRFSDIAGSQVTAMIDRHVLGPGEAIAGFDFSRLEQWEKTGLRLTQDNGQWKVSVAAAKPEQKAIQQWLDETWKGVAATSVEPYTPDRRVVLPSFSVVLKQGKTVRFDKVQESPELLLWRADEGLLYHLPQDVGFTLLNPPAGFRPE